MLYRVDKKPDDFKGLVASLFTGCGSVSVVVDDKWGHFKRTGLLTGEFVIGKAEEAMRRRDMTMTKIGTATAWHHEFIQKLNGTTWRPWHNCFSVLGPLWKKTS